MKNEALRQLFDEIHSAAILANAALSDSITPDCERAQQYIERIAGIAYGAKQILRGDDALPKY